MNDRSVTDLVSENERLRTELATIKEEREVFRNAYLQELSHGDPGLP